MTSGRRPEGRKRHHLGAVIGWLPGEDMSPECARARSLVWSAAIGRFVPAPADPEIDVRSDELLAVLSDDPEVFWTLVFMWEHERRARSALQTNAAPTAPNASAPTHFARPFFLFPC
jgi:hypothetical protein